MNRNVAAVLVVLLAVGLGFFLRPRGESAPVPSAPPAVGEPRELHPVAAPPDVRRPGDLAKVRKALRLAREEGVLEERPAMAPPPVDPSLADPAAPPPARSAWPISKEGIQGAVQEALPELVECYDGWLAENPELEGRVVTSLSIEEVDGVGQITSAEVAEATTGHGAFERCVTSVLSELEFDAPGEGTLSVTYPFVFAQDEPDE